jgi:hypothetical protein
VTTAPPFSVDGNGRTRRPEGSRARNRKAAISQASKFGVATSIAVLLAVARASEYGADEATNDSAVNRASSPTREHEADVATAWFDLVLKLFADEKISPPVAARALAYVGIALYEAVVPGTPTHRSLVGQLNGFRAVPTTLTTEEYHWPTAANSAVATVMRSLFALSSGPSMRIAALESGVAHYSQKSVDAAVFGRSITFGQAVGAAVARWSTEDGYASFDKCAYAPPTGPGLWVPTPPLLSPPVQACWGRLRPFVLRGAFEIDPGPPLAYSEDPQSEFYKDAKEVYETVNGLTPERRAITLFWADGPGTVTPAGHTVALLRRLTWERGYRLDFAAEAYARVGLAAADAFISCWAVKYRHNVLRPVTYIRKVIDPTWSPFLVTPQFPEYTSGHSMQSGATMQVLTGLLGTGFAFTDRSAGTGGFGESSLHLIPPGGRGSGGVAALRRHPLSHRERARISDRAGDRGPRWRAPDAQVTKAPGRTTGRGGDSRRRP